MYGRDETGRPVRRGPSFDEYDRARRQQEDTYCITCGRKNCPVVNTCSRAKLER